ncbi:3-hydroxybutyrate dehydrogenase [Sedimenticola selenatireducens]|uniref:3-hydroxybutyrate dehydrogenase n=1 Tax=Sedimenticola selenatireducens TaxID=191960 RepID=A0A557S9P4_9GAMM|nr:3-hydroxybutyrate dehydrogenase [Sedimenticola selenatireducens]TVO74107.1 3-hydroxybutyrate dehydrogenase [Sedimenticola selenatireducens]TVT61627.1 MAG: 3-hydroxybutyrate dehydrogenase [Sedimenticola selenatireducens]
MQNKVAVVTGGASGIGLAVAKKLNSLGCKVVIADFNLEAGGVAAEGIGATFIQADLSDADQCRSLIEQTTQLHGGVDILVNNAGFQHISPIEEFPIEQWNKLLGVMLTAPFLLMRYSWPMMKQKGWGRVINIASVHAMVASPFKAGYISAKHGVIGLTKTAALEGGEFGITVNAICPAYVRTPLVENQIADQARTRGIKEEEVVTDVMLKNAAIKKLIEPEEVANLVAFLASDQASSITGSSLTIDSGWTAQ